MATKETKEAIKAVLLLLDFAYERSRDGFGVDDFVAFISEASANQSFQKKLKDGFDGLDKISVELKDISKEELAMLGYEMAPEFISFLSKLKK